MVRTIQTIYDLRDRIQSISSAGSITQTLRDAVGNFVIQTDANLNPPTNHSYDTLDRLTETLDALGNLTTYQYDILDRVSQVTSPIGATTTNEYVALLE